MKLFLDLDNTVTESRGKISEEMSDTLRRYEFVHIISGAAESQMRSQIGDLDCVLMSQNGNVNPLWERLLTEEERKDIIYHIHQYTTIEDDQLEDRGAQISYSFVGHHADIQKKKQFDPEGFTRRVILREFPLTSDLIEVRIGGTTCLDYFPKGLNKGTNIERYIAEKGWKKSECIYVGDALFPGGNDETVIGIIPTFPIKNHLDTLTFLS